MISFLIEAYNRMFRPRRSNEFKYLMHKLVESTDEIIDLNLKLRKAEETLVTLQEENNLLWDQLGEINEADKALKNQLTNAMEDAYLRTLKTVGDA
ncbi:MAG: hypothetical protein CMQ51_07095 [Gammaproteobacteria bacterium]|nr:hypothetical protein [Gammaproteobacteria bacterium]